MARERRRGGRGDRVGGGRLALPRRPHGCADTEDVAHTTGMNIGYRSATETWARSPVWGMLITLSTALRVSVAASPAGGGRRSWQGGYQRRAGQVGQRAAAESASFIDAPWTTL